MYISSLESICVIKKLFHNNVGLKNLLLLQINKSLFVTFTIFVFFFLIQKYMIYPIEKYLFPSYLIDKASILYLPHAIRIIAYYVLGFKALIPIFISQCFTFIYLNNGDVIETIILSASSTFTIYLGFQFFKHFKNQASFNLDEIVDWKKIILIGTMVSIINSTVGSLYFFTFDSKIDIDLILNLRFIMGDIFGLLFGMFLFIFILKFSGLWMTNVKYKSK